MELLSSPKMLIQINIRFDSRSHFSIPDFNWDKNDIIFGVDNSSSVHVDNNKKDILVLSEGLTRPKIR